MGRGVARVVRRGTGAARVVHAAGRAAHLVAVGGAFSALAKVDVGPAVAAVADVAAVVGQTVDGGADGGGRVLALDVVLLVAVYARGARGHVVDGAVGIAGVVAGTTGTARLVGGLDALLGRVVAARDTAALRRDRGAGARITLVQPVQVRRRVTSGLGAGACDRRTARVLGGAHRGGDRTVLRVRGADDSSGVARDTGLGAPLGGDDRRHAHVVVVALGAREVGVARGRDLRGTQTLVLTVEALEAGGRARVVALVTGPRDRTGGATGDRGGHRARGVRGLVEVTAVRTGRGGEHRDDRGVVVVHRAATVAVLAGVGVVERRVVVVGGRVAQATGTAARRVVLLVVGVAVVAVAARAGVGAAGDRRRGVVGASHVERVGATVVGVVVVGVATARTLATAHRRGERAGRVAHRLVDVVAGERRVARGGRAGRLDGTTLVVGRVVHVVDRTHVGAAVARAAGASVCDTRGTERSGVRGVVARVLAVAAGHVALVAALSAPLVGLDDRDRVIRRGGRAAGTGAVALGAVRRGAP